MVEILSRTSYASNVSITFFCVEECDVVFRMCSKGCCKDDDVAHLSRCPLLLPSGGPCPHVP